MTIIKSETSLFISKIFENFSKNIAEVFFKALVIKDWNQFKLEILAFDQA